MVYKYKKVKTICLKILLLILLNQSLWAQYTDPQHRFSLEPPEKWQIQPSNDGSGMAVISAPEDRASLFILPMEVTESAALSDLPFLYQKFLKYTQPGISLRILQQSHISLAGTRALQRTYSVAGESDKASKSIVTFIKMGRLALTLAATASDTIFSEIKPVFEECLQTLHFHPEETWIEFFSAADTLQLREFQSELKALEQAFQNGLLDEEEYAQKKAELEQQLNTAAGLVEKSRNRRLRLLEEARQAGLLTEEEFVRKKEELETPSTTDHRTLFPEEALRLRYNVQPGQVFEAKIAMQGNIRTEIFRTEGVEESTKSIKYELVARQKIESVEEEDILVIKIEPMPETVSLSIGGHPREINVDLLPNTLFRMTRQGEIKEIQYSTPINRVLLGSEVFDFSSVAPVFLKFPDEPVEIGSRWELSPAVPETGAEGNVNLLSVEEINERPCAVLQIHSTMPLSFPDSETGQGDPAIRIQGRIERNLHQFTGLETGWPLSGNGEIKYEITLFRGEEKLSHTIYSFELNYSTMF